MTKRISPAGSGRGKKGASERRVQNYSTPSEAKPESRWTCGPAPSSAATPRVCHRPPDCTRGSPHSSAHPHTLCCWLSHWLRRYEVSWCPSLKTSPKTITVAGNLFLSPWARLCYSWQSSDGSGCHNLDW